MGECNARPVEAVIPGKYDLPTGEHPPHFKATATRNANTGSHAAHGHSVRCHSIRRRKLADEDRTYRTGRRSPDSSDASPRDKAGKHNSPMREARIVFDHNADRHRRPVRGLGPARRRSGDTGIRPTHDEEGRAASLGLSGFCRHLSSDAGTSLLSTGESKGEGFDKSDAIVPGGTRLLKMCQGHLASDGNGFGPRSAFSQVIQPSTPG